MAYMNILLRLTQTLCQSPWEISKDDLAEEYAALSYLTAEGFQLDWLGKKLDEVKVKKKKEKACLAQLREIEKELQPLKRKYSEMEAQMDKVKAELSAAKSPVSLYDEDVAWRFEYLEHFDLGSRRCSGLFACVLISKWALLKLKRSRELYRMRDVRSKALGFIHLT